MSNLDHDRQLVQSPQPAEPPGARAPGLAPGSPPASAGAPAAARERTVYMGRATALSSVEHLARTVSIYTPELARAEAALRLSGHQNLADAIRTVLRTHASSNVSLAIASIEFHRRRGVA